MSKKRTTTRKTSKQKASRRPVAKPTKVYEGLWRAKWTTDGAKTLEAAAKKLESAAAYLRGLARDGIELRQPIEDDHGFFETTDPKVAKKHEMAESDEDEDAAEY